MKVKGMYFTGQELQALETAVTGRKFTVERILETYEDRRLSEQQEAESFTVRRLKDELVQLNALLTRFEETKEGERAS